jgi:cephalosporin-C deacetylase
MFKGKEFRLWTHRIAAGLGLALLIGPVAARLSAAEPAYQLRLVTDRPEATYQVGETAKFLISVTQGEAPVTSGEVTYEVDDFIQDHPPATPFPRGQLTLDDGVGSVAVSLDQPGFRRCRATFKSADGKTVAAIAAAAFAPQKIEPSLPTPDDFDQFWTDQKSALAEVPMAAQLSAVDSPNPDVQCYDVQIPCLGGAPVSGYLALPKDAAAQSLPAILWVHGAGVRSSVLANAVQGATHGMLSMDINAHGIPNGKPAQFYADLIKGRLKNYRHEGRENRDTIYFRGMVLRLIRALDYLASRPEWDGKVLVAIGHSQGGGQALMAGGIDDRVTLIATGVPALCDHGGRAAGRVNGWPKLVPTGPDGAPELEALRASRYVDAVNFASRCKAEAIMSVGFIDMVCPPSSCYAAYNCLQGPKQIINEPLMGHAAPAHIHDAFMQCVLEHVRRRAGKTE